MATEIKLPSLGEGVTSGDVLEILVKEGESVKQGTGLMELETDKATMTVPCPTAGKIVSINVKAGETVSVGMVIATLEASSAAAAPAPAAPPKPAPAPAPAPEAPKPAPVAEAPKPAPAAPAPVAPKPAPVVERQVVPAAPAPMAAVADDAEVGGEIAAGPAIRRLAREVGIELSQVVGTGEGGRITRDDVMRSVRESAAQRAAGNQLVTTNGSKGLTAPGADPQSQNEYGPVRNRTHGQDSQDDRRADAQVVEHRAARDQF